MRTTTNSTRNTSTKSVNNQQRKSFSNNLVILTGNLGADAAFFGANDSAASFRMATKSKFGEKEYVEWHSVVIAFLMPFSMRSASLRARLSL